MFSELELLKNLLPHLPGGDGMVVGPGDDCAVLALPGSSVELLAAVDQLIENVHFTQKTGAAAAGTKLMNRNLSDIAAMGGRPRWALLTLAAGADSPHEEAWMLEFCRGAAAAGALHGVPLAGGDVAHQPGTGFAATLTILGEVPKGTAVLRSGAKPGDSLYVTGSIGNSFVTGHHLDFKPRLAEGEYLRTRATAMLDVSDGLLLDAGRLAAASEVDLLLDPYRVPLRAGAALPEALGDGEDYELLFTARAGLAASWPAPLVPIAEIGRVVSGDGRVRNMTDGKIFEGRTGYEH